MTITRAAQIAQMYGVDTNATNLDSIARLIDQTAHDLASAERMYVATAGSIARTAAGHRDRTQADIDAGKTTHTVYGLGSDVAQLAEYATKIQVTWQNLANLAAARDQMLAKTV